MKSETKTIILTTVMPLSVTLVYDQLRTMVYTVNRAMKVNAPNDEL